MTPHISQHQSCLPKSKEGLGIKDFTAWNKADVAKLVWAITEKRGILWARWVHGRYIRGGNWWDYTPPDSSWYWKKLCRVKEIFKTTCYPTNQWSWQGGKDYTVKKGYDWLLQSATRVKWDKARMSIPRHSFIMWIFIHHRMPTKVRLLKFHPQDNLCLLYTSPSPRDGLLSRMPSSA